MNSADQGVFPLDSSFKRRWSFLYKDITAPRSPAAVTKICLYHNGKPMEILWDDFRAVINDWIIANNYDEDRCIGPWHFKDEELADINEFTLCNDAEKRSTMSNPFVDKLLMYLRQDVFRMNADQLFSENFLSMSKIRRAFYGNDDKFTADGNKNNSNPVDIENIFVSDVSQKLKELEWQSPAVPSPADDVAATPTDDVAAITTDGNSNEQ